MHPPLHRSSPETTHHHATPQSYRPDIDGLRAVAVLAVVLNHLSSSLAPGGFVGVDVFFVISGCLITGIIGREMDEGRFTFVRFYERRARRIFPALFVMLTATLTVGYFLLLPSDYVRAFQGALATVFFASNLMLLEAAGRLLRSDRYQARSDAAHLVIGC